MYKDIFKRIFDFSMAFLSITFLSPVLVVLIVVLYFANNSQPFFLQERPGKNGKLFKIIKFKTMRDIDKSENIDIHSPERITKVGHFVRKYSLDELLQLVNVLVGDMSLVGPRPLLVEYLPLYNAQQRKRLDVLPGITGWAQVNGRNAISWNEKFELDAWYVENISFWLDVKIIIKTFTKVLKQKDINQKSDVIMPVWTGNGPQSNT